MMYIHYIHAQKKDTRPRHTYAQVVLTKEELDEFKSEFNQVWFLVYESRTRHSDAQSLRLTPTTQAL
jgi:hypothetical protein